MKLNVVLRAELMYCLYHASRMFWRRKLGNAMPQVEYMAVPVAIALQDACYRGLNRLRGR